MLLLPAGRVMSYDCRCTKYFAAFDATGAPATNPAPKVAIPRGQLGRFPLHVWPAGQAEGHAQAGQDGLVVDDALGPGLFFGQERLDVKRLGDGARGVVRQVEQQAAILDEQDARALLADGDLGQARD